MPGYIEQTMPLKLCGKVFTQSPTFYNRYAEKIQLDGWIKYQKTTTKNHTNKKKEEKTVNN